MKLTALLLVAGLAVALAAMTAAWKRACLEMARTVFGVRLVSRLPAGARNRFVPKFVVIRQRATLILMVAAAVLGGAFYGWLAAIGVFVGVWLLGESLAFILPLRDHHYYASQAIEDFREREALHARAGDDATAAHFRERREQLEFYFCSQSVGEQ